MPLSEGQRWSNILSRELKQIANQIKVERASSTTKCPGAFDPLTGEFDPKRDRAYHAANPGAAVCTAGIVGTGNTASTILGFHFPNLKDSQLDFLSIGELGSNQAILIAAEDQNLTNIRRYEFPLGSGSYYRIEEGFPRMIELNNFIIFRYAISVKE